MEEAARLFEEEELCGNGKHLYIFFYIPECFFFNLNSLLYVFFLFS